VESLTGTTAGAVSSAHEDILHERLTIPEVDDALARLKATVRCIALGQTRKPGKCFFTGKDTDRWAIFAKSY
jgi:hypothetical protein